MTSHIMVYLCLISAVLCAVSLYICLFCPYKTQFVKVIIAFSAVFLIHLSQVIVCELFFPSFPWLDRWTPLGIIYGPFIYFGLTCVKKQLELKTILLHSIPFFIGCVLYIAAVTMMARQVYYEEATKVASAIGYMRIFSVFIYMVWSFFYLQKEKRKSSYQQHIRIFLYVLLPGVFYVIIGIVFALVKEQLDVFMIRFMIYSVMLSISIGIFLFSHQNLVETYERVEGARLAPDFIPLSSGDHIKMEEANRRGNDIYSKSALPRDLLETYEQLICHSIENDKLYLDPYFSLESFSKRLKVPKHHLSQTFSLQINNSFSNFINFYRVGHACDLMEERRDLHLVSIGEMSGFNSKTSFNRNFKFFKNCTPHEYRASLEEA